VKHPQRAQGLGLEDRVRPRANAGGCLVLLYDGR
jgi:hypothetical protein